MHCFSFFSRDTIWKVGWVQPIKIKTLGSSCGSCGMNVPLIMHWLCFSFAGLRAANLSKSPFLNWRNLESPHGISRGMIIWPLSSCIAYLFLLQRNKLQNWVSPPWQIRKTGVYPCELWMRSSLSCVAFLYSFQRNKLKKWVSHLPQTQGIWGILKGLHMAWKIPADPALLFFFFSRKTLWRDGWVSPPKL